MVMVNISDVKGPNRQLEMKYFSFFFFIFIANLPEIFSSRVSPWLMLQLTPLSIWKESYTHAYIHIVFQSGYVGRINREEYSWKTDVERQI